MKALWRGRLPLARTFWEYAVLYVALANICATGAAFGMIAADLPIVLAVIVFLLPLPIVVVGVWRSAAAYRGPQYWAAMAPYAALIWGGLMVLI